MSVLVFLEESRRTSSGSAEYYATVAGAAVEEIAYDDFCRKLLRLKERFFKRKGVAEVVLRGRSLLNSRALSASFRKIEFTRELFSLCRLLKVISFATTKKCPLKIETEAGLAQFQLPRSAVTNSDKYTEEAVSLLLAYLIERVNSFMLERHPGQVAKLIFRTEETHRDDVRSQAVMNFIYRTPFGSGFHGILGAPLLMPSALSPGLQLADVFAYVINQHHAGRKDLADLFREVEEMQFVSSISKDEYELRGMNLIE